MPDKGYIPRKRYPAAGNTSGLDKDLARIVRKILDKQTVDEQFNYEAIENNALWRYDFDQKGDLLVGTAPDRAGRFAVGPNFKVLRPDTTQPSGLNWDNPAPTWTGSALPTTDLWMGRRVWATNLANPLFGPNNGIRLYQYGEAPIGQTGPCWRLVTPIVYTIVLATDRTLTATAQDIFSLYFGEAPCPVDVKVTLSGARNQAVANIAHGRISRTVSGSPAGIGNLRIDYYPLVAGEVTGEVSYHESRAAGDDISYGFQAHSQGTTTWRGTASGTLSPMTLRAELS